MLLHTHFTPTNHMPFQFLKTHPLAFFWDFVHGFSFFMQFTAQVQASVRATARRILVPDLLPCVPHRIPTTSTRLPHDNIYEFNNNTLILITMKRLTNIITKINSIMAELGTAAAYAIRH